MDFNSERKGTGTAEWAEVNENICRGCVNNCLYCYAAANAKRFKLRDRDQWHIEEFTKRAAIKSYPARKGVIMFPSSHDITPFNVDEYVRVATLMLEKGNRLLIVSKPRFECIEKLIVKFEKFKQQILFRFTIGTIEDRVSRFWEPGAPLPVERLTCLYTAKDFGYRTSVSIEPMLEGVDGACMVVEVVKEHVTDTIWIGKMNKKKLRVDLTSADNFDAVECLERYQCDDEIRYLFSKFENDPTIRWKDSIKAVVAG